MWSPSEINRVGVMLVNLTAELITLSSSLICSLQNLAPDIWSCNKTPTVVHTLKTTEFILLGDP